MKQQKWLSFAVTVLMIFLCAGMVGAESAVEGTAVPVAWFTYTQDNPLYTDGTAETNEFVFYDPEVMPISGEEDEPVEYSEAMEEAREAIFNWQESVTVSYWLTEEEYNYLVAEEESHLNEYLSGTLSDIWKHGASDHGRSGDYFRWHYQTMKFGVGLSKWGTPSGETTGYSIKIQYMPIYYTTAEQEAEVDETVATLVEKWSAQELTEYQIIRTIYDYICETVDYDQEHKNNPEYKLMFTAYAALYNKTAVCQGYSTLFYRLAREMGIDARLIAGTGNDEPHAWNIVELGGVYYTLDTTWDEWQSEEPAEYQWFMLSEGNFYKKVPLHVRNTEYTSEEFKEDYPLSTTDFLWSSNGKSGVYDNITWTLSDDGTLTLSGAGDMYNTSDWWEVLPSWYDYRDSIKKVVVGKDITSIGSMAFYEHKNLSEIDIQGDITFIGHHAFSGTALNSFTVPNTVEDIAEGVFEASPFTEILVEAPGEEQETYFVSKDGVLFTGDEKCLFAYPCAKAGTSYTVPDGVEVLYLTAFGCSELEEIVLPDTLKVINDWAFGNCETLKSLEIPANVEFIGGSFISNTPSLKSITFRGASPVPMIGWDAFSGNEGHTVIYYPADAEGWKNAVKISGGVPFWQPTDENGEPNNPELLALPTGATAIVSDAPVEGTDITWSLGGDGVLTISGTGEIPDYDWDAPWYNCRSIVNTVNIGCGDGDNITRVGSTAFVEMNHLQTVNFGNSVTRIGHKAFEGTGLTTFTLPASVEEIDGGAFARMYNVTAFEVEEGNEHFKAVDGVLYSKDGAVLHTYPLAASADTFVVPEGVKEIAPNAFEASPNLKNVTLNDGLETIHSGAFNCSEQLTDITIPASVRFIGWGAFEFIDTLEWAKFEGMLPTFEGNIFNRETSLDNFVIHYPMAYGWTNVVYADDEGNTFWQPNENPEYRMEGYEVKDYNPDGILDSGIIEDTWIDDENCGEIRWSLTNSGVLTISGTGEIPNYNGDNRAPWYPYAGMICEISIGEDIPVIGEDAFWGLTALKSLTIPDTVMEIRMGAFSECYSLESLELGNGVKSISHKAFAWTAVSNFTVPASVEHLDDGAFALMMNVSKYTVHDDNPYYYTDEDGVIFCRDTNILAAFPPASDITAYEVPDNAMGVYGHAFERCEKLKKVILPYILPQIHFTFSECKSLTEVYFKSGLPGEIGDCIFGERMEEYHENLVLYFPYGTEIEGEVLDENSVVTWYPYGDEGENGRAYTVKGWNYTVPEGELTGGDFGTVHWLLDFDGLLTISPIGDTGVIHEPEDEFPWFNCRDLITKLSVEDGVTEIGGWAFHDLYRLTEADIAASVKRICGNAFISCENLEKVTLREGLEVIEHKAFENTAIESLTIPTTVHELHDGAFARMHALTEIKMADNSEHFKAVDGVLYTEDGKGLLAYPAGREDEFYEIPDGTEEIWGHAFEATKVQNVTIPDSVTFIAGRAFHSSNLTSIEIPLTIAGIDDCAFENCNALTDVTFKGGYEWLGGNVFYREENLEGIMIHYPIGMPGWPDEAVEKLYLEHNPEEGYTAEGYEVSGTLVSGEIELEEDGMLEWSISADGTLTVTGSGAIPDYSWDHESNPAPWRRYANLITDISIGNEITRIGSKAFAQLYNVHYVEVPGNVEEIGESAFRFNDSLNEITLNEGLRLIEHGAFGETNIWHLRIPSTVEEMHGGALAYMPNVGFYEVDGNSEHFYNDEHGAVYTADGRELFAYPPQHDVDSYTVAAGTERIKDSAFTYCEHLTSVTLPTTLKVLEGWVFPYCDNLETVTFRTGIPEEVGPWLFGETEDHGNGEVYNPHLPTLEFPAGSAGWEEFKAGDTTTWTPNENFEYTVTFYKPETLSGDIEGTDIHWELDFYGNLTIFGTGEIPNYNWDSAPWYKYAADIVSIDIGSGITRIGENAFSGCSALRSIDIPGNVKSIGMFAFSGCYRLGEITLNEGLEIIEHRAFNETAVGYLWIPASVREIHGGALSYMQNAEFYDVDDNSEFFYNDEYGAVYTADGRVLIAYPARSGEWHPVDEENDIHEYVLHTSYIVPNGVERIDHRAFVYCDSLMEVTFPSTLTSISDYLFEYCTNLETLTFKSGKPETNGGMLFGDIGQDGEGHVYYEPKIPTILFPKDPAVWGEGDTAEWVIEWMEEDENGEPYTRSNTFTVTFYEPETHSGDIEGTDIHWELDFDGNLTISGTGEIPNGQAPWYEYAADIVSINIGEGITRIGNDAFADCSALRSIDIPGNVKSIGMFAFGGCYRLEEITLNEGLEVIEHRAFNDAIAWNLYIPASVREIHGGGITFMPNVDWYEVDDNSEYFYNDEFGAVYSSDGKRLIAYPARSGWYDEENDTHVLHTSYTVADGVEKVESRAFVSCDGLTEVTFPSTLNELGAFVFERCCSLETVTFRSGVPNIYEDNGGYLFGEPERDEDGNYISGTEFPEIRFPAGSNGWENTNPGDTAKWTITFKPEGEEENQSMTYDVIFYDGMIASGDVTDTLTWQLGYDGVLTVSGTGEMPDWDNETTFVPWNDYKNMIREVMIESGVTSIGQNAFSGGEYSNLSKVTLPEGLLTIGHDAFAWGNPLTEITIPASVTDCAAAFSGNERLEAIHVAEGNPYYYSEDGVLYRREEDGYTTLINYPGAKDKHFTVPEGVNSIGVNAFAGLGMEEIVLPNSLRDINGYAFSDSRMSELDIPASVISVGNNILAGNDQIQIIRFYGDKPEHLDDHAFDDIASEYQIIYRKSANGWEDIEGAESFIYRGDVSADGVLNEQDVKLLNQYFAGWATDESFDVDAVISRKDAMVLARILAGWPEDILKN